MRSISYVNSSLLKPIHASSPPARHPKEPTIFGAIPQSEAKPPPSCRHFNACRRDVAKAADQRKSQHLPKELPGKARSKLDVTNLLHTWEFIPPRHDADKNRLHLICRGSVILHVTRHIRRATATTICAPGRIPGPAPEPLPTR